MRGVRNRWLLRQSLKGLLVFIERRERKQVLLNAYMAQLNEFKMRKVFQSWLRSIKEQQDYRSF